MKTSPEDQDFAVHVGPDKVLLDMKAAQTLPLVASMSGGAIKQRIDKFFHEVVVERLADSDFESMLTKGLAERVERAIRGAQSEIETKTRAAVIAALTRHVDRIVAEQYEVVVAGRSAPTAPGKGAESCSATAGLADGPGEMDAKRMGRRSSSGDCSLRRVPTEGQSLTLGAPGEV